MIIKLEPRATKCADFHSSSDWLILPQAKGKWNLLPLPVINVNERC